MTKEDFNTEVYEYAKSRNGTEDSRMTDRMLAYRAGAELREKRIIELETTNKRISDECHKLVGSLEKKQNEIVELIGKVAFLENDLNNAKAQIEKMKCCENCKYLAYDYEDMFCSNKKHCKNRSLWKLRR